MIIRPVTAGRRDHELVSAARAYAQYSVLAHRELSRMQSSYSTLGRQHKRIGYDLGYTRKLNTLAKTIDVNAILARKISEMAGGDSSIRSIRLSNTGERLHQIRDVFKQLVREWSSEGAEERSEASAPIMEVLATVSPFNRRETMVLVPGAGLGRLSWEIATMGFHTTSNEVSPYMNLAFQLLFSRSATSRIHQHIMHPFAHWFSHQRSTVQLFRSVTFPDVLPSCHPESQLHHDQSDFLGLVPVSDGYDYIVTQFFIDTSYNIIATLQKVHDLLKYGGTWINFGPLLWMSGAQAAMELSLEEVLELCDTLGLEIQQNSRRSISLEYTRDNTAMMRYIYEAEFWTAIKR